eukprot:Skav207459  [mRNA]  locus=scaffold3545:163559:163783:- [translate_table: standard]
MTSQSSNFDLFSSFCSCKASKGSPAASRVSKAAISRNFFSIFLASFSCSSVRAGLRGFCFLERVAHVEAVLTTD